MAAKTKPEHSAIRSLAGGLMRGCAEWVERRHTVLMGRAALVLALSGSVLIVIFGLSRIDGFVRGLPQYHRPLVLEWEALPDWLQTTENGHILDRIVARLGLRPDDSPLDAALAARLGRALSAEDLGWVRRIERIRIRPDGVVSIRCEFRQPKAWVKVGKYCYLVDQDSIRLPGRYRPEDCRGSPLMMIVGVRSRPPDVGQLWPPADLASGMKLVTLLSHRPFRDQIAAISVDNYRGRADRRLPHVELTTNHREGRIWWGRAPGEEDGLEISAAQKLALLETLYRQSGRVDMDRPYVNIMTWPDRVAMPIVLSTALEGRTLRG